MKKMSELTVAVAIPIILLVNDRPAFGQGQVFWQANGVLVCDATFEGGSRPLAIAEDGSGGAITIWADTRGTYESVYAQRLDRDGNCLWAPNGVCLRNNTWFPDKITAASDGRAGAIVVWEDDPGLGVPPQVRAQRVDSNGVVRWGPQGIIVAWDTANVWYWPSLVTDGQGGAIVSWVAETFDTAVVCSLYAQRVDSSGVLRWPSGGVLIQSGVNRAYPATAIDGKNGVLVAWSDNRGGEYDIYGQRVDSSGALRWGPEGSDICTADSGQFAYPGGIASDDAGGGIVTWVDKRNGDYDVYCQRVDSVGLTRWQVDGVPACTTSGSQWEPALVVSNGRKGGIVAWSDERSENCYDVYVQAVDSLGTPNWLTNGVFVSTMADTSVSIMDLELATVWDSRSGVISIWKDARAGNWDIYCQRVDSSGVLRWGLGALAVCSDPENQDWGPVTVEDSSGGAIIAWGDRRPPGPGASIYAQRVGDAVGVKEAANDQSTMTNDQFLRIYPNPFGAGGTTISFNVKRSTLNVSLRVYDLRGRLIRTLVDGKPIANSEQPMAISWDGRDGSGRPVRSGVYFCKLTTAKLQSTAKMTLLK